MASPVVASAQQATLRDLSVRTHAHTPPTVESSNGTGETSLKDSALRSGHRPGGNAGAGVRPSVGHGLATRGSCVRFRRTHR